MTLYHETEGKESSVDHYTVSLWNSLGEYCLVLYLKVSTLLSPPLSIDCYTGVAIMSWDVTRPCRQRKRKTSSTEAKTVYYINCSTEEKTELCHRAWNSSFSERWIKDEENRRRKMFSKVLRPKIKCHCSTST